MELMQCQEILSLIDILNIFIAKTDLIFYAICFQKACRANYKTNTYFGKYFSTLMKLFGTILGTSYKKWRNSYYKLIRV